MGLHTAPAWNTLSNDLRPRTTPPFNELHDAGYYSWLSESSVSQASLSSASEQSVTSMLSVSSRSLSISGGTLVTTVYTTYPDGSSSSSESTTIILPASPSQTPTPTPPTTTLTSTGLSSLHSLSSLTSTSSSSTSSSFLTPTEVPQNVAASSTPMCVGNGMDTQAIGVTTALVLGLGFGLLVWAAFAIIRPRARSLYALREWFPAPPLRPRPLSNGLFAFLNPPVPLVPPYPSDDAVQNVRNARTGNTQPGQDPCAAFPSDEQLAQRSLWVIFLIVLGWTFLALIAALPIYMVNTPCVSSSTQPTYGGRYGTLADLSILRLLKMLDNGKISAVNQQAIALGTHARSLVNDVRDLHRRLLDERGHDLSGEAERRLIALCVIIIVLALLPALLHLWFEFSRLANYYDMWDKGRCEGVEMAYLGCGTTNHWFSGNRGGAWGWRGWGEGQVKAFFRKAGLGSGPGMGGPASKSTSAIDILLKDHDERRRKKGTVEGDEKAEAEINITGVFSVWDTTQLAQLIDERDIILDRLEEAEARYIASFQPITPSPSPSLRSHPALPPVLGSDAANPEASLPSPRSGFFGTIGSRSKRSDTVGDSVASTSSDPHRDFKAKISRPRALKGSYARNRGNYIPVPGGNLQDDPSAAGLSAGAGTGGYLAPSQYYRLRDVQGVSGGKIAGTEEVFTVADRQKQLHLQRQQLPEARNGNGHKRNGSFQALKQRLLGVGLRNGGSRFMEINRDSVHGKLPLGSRVAVTEHGELAPVPIPAPDRGPNHADNSPSPDDEDEEERDEFIMVEDAALVPEDENVGGTANNSTPRAAAAAGAPRTTVMSAQSFPMRPRKKGSGADDEPPAMPHERLQQQQPFRRPISGLEHAQLGIIYADIRRWRGALKRINREITEAQERGFQDIAEGLNIKGWVLVGRGLRFLRGVQMIEGRTKEDIRWEELQVQGGFWSRAVFWIMVVIIGVLLGIGLVAVIGLASSTQPEVVHYLPWLGSVARTDSFHSALATAIAPALAGVLFVWISLAAIRKAARYSGAVSVSVARLKAFKAVFWVFVIVAGIWIVAAGSLIIGVRALDDGQNAPSSIANGSVTTAIFLLIILLNIAIIAPGLLLLQPVRLWKMWKAKKRARTPRQLFRVIYPKAYDPSYALSACVLAIVFVAAFALVFPLIGPPVVLLIFLTLIAHRFLVGYVFGRTDSSQTGGLLQLWVLRRFATLIALQPLLLGLLLLSRELWILGSIMAGVAVLIVCIVEGYASWRLRKPGRRSLSAVTRHTLRAYENSARPRRAVGPASEEKSTITNTSDRPRRRNGHTSISSVLDMMNITLAVMPSPARNRGPVPLPTEHLDDLIATERAARTHPEAPPRLPPLAFVDAAEEMAGILYPPALTAPAPTIWLPNDSAGVARSEAYDLQHYHHLAVTIDVRTLADAKHTSRAERSE